MMADPCESATTRGSLQCDSSGIREEPRYVAAPMELSQHVLVQKSRIHGKGVFASRLLSRGSVIGEYDGPVRKRNGRYVLWVEQHCGCWIGIDGRNELRYLNHSLIPNAEFRGTLLVATRDIHPGEEITFHYGDEWEDVP
jgi:SET domain-containing protein